MGTSKAYRKLSDQFQIYTTDSHNQYEHNGTIRVLVGIFYYNLLKWYR